MRRFWVDCRQDRGRWPRVTRYGSGRGMRALLLTCPRCRRHRPGPPRWPDQKPVRRWRDPSQMCRSVIPPRPVPTFGPMPWKETRGLMPMLAELVDAVIGIDTHRDSHEVEIADATGTPLATMRISNDSVGFGQLLAAIAEVAPGPRVAVSLEGSRSYGVGLARVLAAAGLLVIECE